MIVTCLGRQPRYVRVVRESHVIVQSCWLPPAGTVPVQTAGMRATPSPRCTPPTHTGWMTASSQFIEFKTARMDAGGVAALTPNGCHCKATLGRVTQYAFEEKMAGWMWS